MGKRKSSSKPMGPRKADPLPTSFACLFCSNETSVTVKLEKKAGVGQLTCNNCHQTFQCSINYLSAPVDVYGEWVDAADEVARQSKIAKRKASAPSSMPSSSSARRRNDSPEPAPANNYSEFDEIDEDDDF